MTDPGLPLTTGEGNTASESGLWSSDNPLAPRVITLRRERDEAVAECDALREQLDAARQALEVIANTVDPCSGNDRAKDLMDALLTVGSLARAALGGCPLSDRPLTTREGAAEARARAEAWLAGLVRRDMTASIATATDLARDVVALTDELLEGG